MTNTSSLQHGKADADTHEVHAHGSDHGNHGNDGHDHGHEHGHDHGHGHGHSHAPKDFGNAFLVGVILNTGFVAIEAIYGLLSHSLALLADVYSSKSGLPNDSPTA
jgi:cobalt-zinc-cadmium efflux system protein